MTYPYAARRLNDRPVGRSRHYALLWIQQAQRSRNNPSLEFAAERANELRLPLVAGFGLTPGYPEANRRHYAFLIEGLFALRDALAERGIPLVLRLGRPADTISALAARAAILVCDRGYLRHQAAWREDVARAADCAAWEVEGEVCVPVDMASNREEYAARTLRPKLRAFLDPLPPLPPRVRLRRSGLGLDLPHDWTEGPDALLARLPAGGGAGRVPGFQGGETAARARLGSFLRQGLAAYPDAHSDPARDGSSRLSPYLHFGQISALEIARRAEAADAPAASRQAFLEQLVVRRELSMNFTRRNPDYDRWEGLPAWARRTLEERAGDRRDVVYPEDALEAGQTHDPYWNAAQLEMVRTGFMHNTMRMYWGKKLLEWTPCPREAFRIALRLNNAYELDGRDPNSYAGVAWCFGKHDRPWARRAIFGTVRYMNDKGLRRKYDMDAYVERVRRPDGR